MTIFLLLFTCVLLSPWMVQFCRYVTTRPEAIPTPAWLVTTNVLFLFLMPLITGFVWGESFTGHDRAAGWIAFTSVSYWFTFAAVYRLLSHRQRTVLPDGPTGCQTAFGTLKAATLSMTLTSALAVYVPLLLLRLFFIQGWGLGVSGSGLAMMDLPYYLVIVYLLLPAATGPFTTVFTYLLFGRSSLTAKALSLGPLAANFVFSVLLGRRPSLMFFGFVALGLMWSGRRRRILPLVGLGLATWFILTIFSPVFLRARNLWRTPNGPDVMTAFRIAIVEQGSEEKGEKLREDSAENVKARVNTYAFWLVFYDQFIGKPLGGTAMAQAVLMNTPRFLIGIQKYRYGPTVEYLYGSPDLSNNVSLESFIDLGALGPFAYAALLGALFSIVDRANVRVAAWNKYVAFVAIGPMLECLVSPEDALIGYVSVLRNTLTVAALAFAVSLIIGRRPVSVDPRVTAGLRHVSWSPQTVVGAPTQ